jgi:hypothetical protein
MTGQDSDHHLGHLRLDGAGLRRRLAAVAASIACTEDEVAETLERTALILPEDAARLLARAAQAREYAMLERDQAARLSLPH